MLRHLLRLAWNRKRSNLLLMLEMLLAFLVVFAVTMTGLYLFSQYTLPLGFDHRGVWSVSVVRADDLSEGSWERNGAETFRRLLDEVRALPAVSAAAASNNRPYSRSVSSTTWIFDGRRITSQVGRADEHLVEVLDVELIAGRWFGAEDDGAAWVPVVINEPLAALLFGDADPLDVTINDDPDSTSRPQRVVGVMRSYRHAGEFSRLEPYFFRYNPVEPEGIPVDELLIQVAPGTTAQFEENLRARLLAVAPDWTFTVQPLELARADYFRGTLIPLALLGVVAGFLLSMVVLGLTGVLWQTVTRRTREIGLRRAVGATRRSIHRQVVGEVMLTAALGLSLGTVAVLQLPLLGPFGFLPFSLVATAVALSGLLMVSLAGACGLYPGWTATRVQPAEALHYE
jgi:putative ABC transport system permease protein